VRKATAALKDLEEGRRRRAELQGRQARLDEIADGLARLREQNDRRAHTVSWIPERN